MKLGMNTVLLEATQMLWFLIFLLSVITTCEMDLALMVHEMYCSRTARNSQLLLRCLFHAQEHRGHLKILFCFQPDVGF